MSGGLTVRRSGSSVAWVLFTCLATFATAQGSEYTPDAIARFHINQGKYLIERQGIQEANAEFQTALEVAESALLKAESTAWQAQLHATFLDDPDGAIQKYEEVVSKYPSSPVYRTSILQLGLLNYQQQNLDKSRFWFLKFSKEFPEPSPEKLTAEFMLGQVEENLKEGTLPPVTPLPIINRTIRVALMNPNGDGPIWTSVRIKGECSELHSHHEFHGDILITSRQHQILVNNSSLGIGDIELSAGDVIRLGDRRRYRGTIEVSSIGDGLQIVNKVSLEEYVASVVGSEVSPGWPLASLKAQAVASRTYAAHAIAHPRTRYDLVDDTHSQVYLGVDREYANTLRAAKETAGEILEFAGRPILAYFMANNGGRSADSADVFGLFFPYFQIADDAFSRDQPMGHWRREFSSDQVQAALASLRFPVGMVNDIKIGTRDGSGRVTIVEVFAGQKSYPLRARTQFRYALNLDHRYSPENIPDTLFDIRHNGQFYVIEGGGWGHGVGLSQQGAKARAMAGQDYSKILSAYYPGTQLVKVY